MNNEEAAEFVAKYGDLAGEAFCLLKEGKKISKKFMAIREYRMDKGATGHREPCVQFNSEREQEKNEDRRYRVKENIKRPFFLYVKEHLTCKEIRLVRLLMRGHSKIDCAKLLKVSERWVYWACENLRQKLEIVPELSWVSK